jgi:hypothetical protein
MRIEHEYRRPKTGSSSGFQSRPQQPAMGQVDAVEVTDGQSARPEGCSLAKIAGDHSAASTSISKPS